MLFTFAILGMSVVESYLVSVFAKEDNDFGVDPDHAIKVRHTTSCRITPRPRHITPTGRWQTQTTPSLGEPHPLGEPRHTRC